MTRETAALVAAGAVELERADLADAAGFVALHARESIYRGAFAVHGPTTALVALADCYRAAWPRSAVEALERDRQEIAKRDERRYHL